MKTVMLFGTMLALVATSAIALPWMSRSPEVTAGSVLLGDANCDGAVGAIDAALLLQQGAGLLQSIPCPENGDVSGDGMIGAVDAALILQFAAGLVGSFGPAEPPAATDTPAPPPTSESDPASLVYLGGDLNGLGGNAEVIVSADGLTVERFTLNHFCWPGPDDERGNGLYVWQSIRVSLGRFSWSSGNYKVHGAFSADGRMVSGEAWLRVCGNVGLNSPVSQVLWIAYLQ